MNLVAAEKYSASMDHELLEDVRAVAEAEGVTLSAWLAQAARDRVALLGLARLVDDWEAEHGAITDAEMEQAVGALGWVPPSDALVQTRPPARRSA